MEASITFIMVLMERIFLERRIWSKLSLADRGKSSSDIEEALMTMFWSSCGMEHQLEESSFLSSSSSDPLSFALSKSALNDDRILLMSEKALVWLSKFGNIDWLEADVCRELSGTWVIQDECSAAAQGEPVGDESKTMVMGGIL